MTSAINPQNIDGAYPVAGQDNDSQGFRDNFTNIKNNFTYAAQEITDLQSKAVLVAPLTGSVTTNNNMNGTILQNMQLQQFYLTASENLGPGGNSNAAATINYFTTAGPETATLSAGSNGQVKMFCAANVSAGNMTVTVTSAAWGGAGNILFSSNGQGCTLVYTNNKWFCVGNNGATFS